MDLFINIVTVLFAGLGMGAVLVFAIMFWLWYMENKHE